MPDEDRYEQGLWPSRFNSDHKATCTPNPGASGLPGSCDIRQLVSELPAIEVMAVERQDQDFDYSLQRRAPFAPIRAMPLAERLPKRVCGFMPVFGRPLVWKIENDRFRKHGVPSDQTRREAVAQIQVIARKAIGSQVVAAARVAGTLPAR